jgi:hypothetical protein
MLENKFTTYYETKRVEDPKLFHYRMCMGCNEIFKYPNTVSGDDAAPIHCRYSNSKVVSISDESGQ